MEMYKTKKGEVIVWNGIKWYRNDGRKYFRRMYYHKAEYLHIEIYKIYNGEIPKGYQVHHKDGDANNNDPSNLVALSPEQHKIEHRKMGSYKNNRPSEAAYEAAKAWHRSEEGRKWHKEHATKYFDITNTCPICGKEFKCGNAGYRYRICCGRSCATKYRNKRRNK